MKKLIFILRILLSWLYVSCIFLFLFFSLYQRFFSSFVEEGIYQARVVLSSSMEPKIPLGSLLVTKKIPTNQLQVADIIVFSINEETVTHRIISIQNGEIKTKGDANAFEDFGGQKEVKGKVVISIPKIGYFFLMLQNRQGKTAILLTMINLLLIDHLVKLLKIEWLTNKKGLNENEKEKVHTF